jgi:hypothetical protein
LNSPPSSLRGRKGLGELLQAHRGGEDELPHPVDVPHARGLEEWLLRLERPSTFQKESRGYRPHREGSRTLYYAVSRAYAYGTSSLSRAREAIIEKVLQSSKADGSFGDELATACAVCSLANFEYDGVTTLRDAVHHLERQQRADGSWPRVAMFRGSNSYFGSEELTTALCLEALTHLAGRY